MNRRNFLNFAGASGFAYPGQQPMMVLPGSMAQPAEVVDWTAFDADPEGVRDSTAPINAAFAAAAQQNLASHGPAGVYKISGPLQWPDGFPRIFGIPGKTIIRPDAQSYDWLTVGTGAAATNGPAGYVRDLVLSNRDLPRAASGMNAGLTLNATRFVNVENVWVRHAPIGFDLVNNNYGSSFRNCRTQSNECRVGLLLRRESGGGGGFGAGNDMPFFNCWFGGRDAAVWFEGGGGYNFHGGQLLVGSDAAFHDRRGNVIINASPQGKGTLNVSEPASVGSGSLSFFGTSFESTSNGWAIRIWRHGYKVECHSCFFSGHENAAGVLKADGADDGTDIVTLVNTSLAGDWSNATPVILNANNTQRPVFYEVGTHAGGGLTIGGNNQLFVSGTGMLMKLPAAALGRAHAMQSVSWMHQGARFQRAGETIQVSFDDGATWKSFDTTPVA